MVCPPKTLALNSNFLGPGGRFWLPCCLPPFSLSCRYIYFWTFPVQSPQRKSKNINMTLRLVRRQWDAYHWQRNCYQINSERAQLCTVIYGPKNQRKLYLCKVFQESFGSWTSGPKTVDVRTNKFVFLQLQWWGETFWGNSDKNVHVYVALSSLIIIN